MIVRGPEFWGLDLVVTMGVAYVVVLALALSVAVLRRGLRRPATTDRSPMRGRSGLKTDGRW